MFYLIAALVILGIFAALTGLISQKRGESQDVVQVAQDNCATCNGENTKCEQECMMEAAVQDIEYYDDEELDAFKGRPSNQYTEDEVEQFCNVLYTLKPEDIKGWNRSIILRGINIPDQLKDELVMMLEEQT